MKRKILSILLSLAMVFTLMPVANGIAFAAGGADSNCDGTHGDGWVGIDQGDIASIGTTSGKYFLTEDIVISDTKIVISSSTEDITVDLCLNGHSIKSELNDTGDNKGLPKNYNLIIVGDDSSGYSSTLNIHNCRSESATAYKYYYEGSPGNENDNHFFWREDQSDDLGAYITTTDISQSYTKGVIGFASYCEYIVTITDEAVVYVEGNGTLNMYNGTIGLSAVPGVKLNNTNARFNMFGGNISYNDSKNNKSNIGGVVIEQGTFNMSGGCISHNYGYGCGGVIVSQNANFILDGGRIEDNESENTGGVQLDPLASLEMTSGAINSNSSKHYGGVAQLSNATNAAAFKMTGGEIRYNQTENGDTQNEGAGIYLSDGATLKVGGTAKICDNRSADDNGMAGELYNNNLYMAFAEYGELQNRAIEILSGDDAPKPGMNISFYDGKNIKMGETGKRIGGEESVLQEAVSEGYLKSDLTDGYGFVFGSDETGDYLTLSHGGFSLGNMYSGLNSDGEYSENGLYTWDELYNFYQNDNFTLFVPSAELSKEAYLNEDGEIETVAGNMEFMGWYDQPVGGELISTTPAGAFSENVPDWANQGKVYYAHWKDPDTGKPVITCRLKLREHKLLRVLGSGSDEEEIEIFSTNVLHGEANPLAEYGISYDSDSKTYTFDGTTIIGVVGKGSTLLLKKEGEFNYQKLILKNSKILNSENDGHGGIDGLIMVEEPWSLDLQNSTISDCMGPFIIAGTGNSNSVSTIKLYDSAIKNCVAKNGGLLSFGGKLAIDGGEISNNTSSISGGMGAVLSMDADLTIGGDARIINNTPQNLNIMSGTMKFGTGMDDGGNGVRKPCQGMQIGVTASGNFVENPSEEYSGYLFANESGKYVLLNASGATIESIPDGFYKISIAYCEGGSVIAPEIAAEGDTVELNPVASEGYQLKSLKYYKDDIASAEDITDTKSFDMPDEAVTVLAEFEAETPAPDPVPSPASYFSYDVAQYNSVLEEATKLQTEIDKKKAEEAKEEKPVVTESLTVEEVKALAEVMVPTVRTENVTRGIKVFILDSEEIAKIKEAGYTVLYDFYRAEGKAVPKAEDYKITKVVNKEEPWYLNTAAKKGQKYYYKAIAKVYDADGELVAETELTQGKYGVRTRK